MINNYLAFFSILLAIAYFISRKYFKKHLITHIIPSCLIKYKPAKPENTIIAFDFHDVLVSYDYKNIVKTFFNSDKKFKIIFALLNPKIWVFLIKLIFNDAVSEQYIVQTGEKFKSLEPYIPLGIQIANAQKINPQMLNLLQKLKNMGFELHLFSNIGAIIYQDAKNKFPEIFNCFDKVILPSKENGYLRKPHDNAFENYLNESKNYSEKQIIFIDDKLKNIVKAEKYNIIGIKFKNYSQLIQEFKELGIF